MHVSGVVTTQVTLRKGYTPKRPTELWTWELGKRVEVEAVDDEKEKVEDEACED